MTTGLTHGLPKKLVKKGHSKPGESINTGQQESIPLEKEKKKKNKTLSATQNFFSCGKWVYTYDF